mmetsp:Transcript_4497/g.12584  ORF Transcript_4497/g.12584 Transcript_4497/m.12584 type:complete len:205 (+) Transcript_4497:951-1565(+)
MQPSNGHRHREAEANALEAAGVLVLLLLERLEDVLQGLWGDTLARVRDVDLQHAFFLDLACGELDGASDGKLRGICHQVVQELRDLVGVPHDNGQLPRVDVVHQDHVAPDEGPTALVDGHLRHPDHLVDDVHDVYRAAVDLLPAGLIQLVGLGHLHDVGDEVEQAGRAALDHVELPLLHRIRRSLGHGAAEAHDAMQRAAQFVA